MADLAEVWNEALPTIRKGVTGMGVWAALNAARPVALEEGVFVMGLPHEDSALAAHLRIPHTQRLVETTVAGLLNAPVKLRVIEGTSTTDYELVKRRDAERRRLQEAEMTKLRAEMAGRTSWESVYEGLSRRYAAVSNKSLPQNRARFFEEAVELVAEARKGQENWDDASERSFARCIERLAQYSEVPSTLVAAQVLQRAGEL
jgi:hypothetical protein